MACDLFLLTLAVGGVLWGAMYLRERHRRRHSEAAVAAWRHAALSAASLDHRQTRWALQFTAPPEDAYERWGR